MKRFRASLGFAVATAGVVSSISSEGHAGDALPVFSAVSTDGETTFLDAATTTSWQGPALDDGTPTRLYSLSLGRVQHNYTESAELAASVNAAKATRRSWQERRSLYLTMEDTPLFLGWGTHYAYVYAGTPPQRVSVIVDTGSHFTAFPCAECQNCGSHTDPYWDHSKSSSSNVVGCQQCHGSFRCSKTQRCRFSQRYSEGSSWSAFQVEDVLWVGELTLDESEKILHDESAYAVNFMFGCIESQTGLFKTQLADGIMGMSADSHTLVWQLAKAGKIKERIFSLCFSSSGGTMVLGGYDRRLNKPGAVMEYTSSSKSKGWFTVKVTDITLNGRSISSDSSIYQSGKGTIVDSGTTDTYLPKAVAKGFSAAWEAATGKPYMTCQDNDFCLQLTPAELDALPTLVIHLHGDVKVKVPPSAYMDAQGTSNAYAPRIYMEESMGAVLGANVMRDHNVVFDYERRRVGFAEGVCDYRPALDDMSDQIAKHDAGQGNLDGAGVQQKEEEEDVDCVTAKEKVTLCDAVCPHSLLTARTIVGHERWMEIIVVQAQGAGKACPDAFAEEVRACSVECPKGKSSPDSRTDISHNNDGGDGDGGVQMTIKGAVRVEDRAACSLEEEVWTDCFADCLQERFMGTGCEKEPEARVCHVGDLCTSSKMGLILSMGLVMKIDMREGGDEMVKDLVGDRKELWMKWIGTGVSDAVASLLPDVPAGDVETGVTFSNPDVVGQGDRGEATITCAGDVVIHLTPKVDDNAANQASRALNIPTLPQVLTAAMTEAQGNRAQGGLQPRFKVICLAAEEVSMFVASSGDPYMPAIVRDRFQTAYPIKRQATMFGGFIIFALLGVVMVSVYAARARIRRVTSRVGKRSSQDVSHFEMKGNRSLAGSADEQGDDLMEAPGFPVRKIVGVVRGDNS